jgi:hypothetical protein
MAKFCIIALMIAASSFAANTITLSKDSLGVFNDFSGKRDSLVLKNTGNTPVGCDSARIIIDELDTAGSFGRYERNLPKVEIRAWDGIRSLGYDFTMELIYANEYRLYLTGGWSSERKPFTMDSLGDSVILYQLLIGDNFFGGMPIFPDYVRGALRLYFNNNQIVSFGIESTNMRTTSIRKAIPSLRHDAALTNGKKLYSLVNGRILPGNIADLNRKSVRNAQYKLEVKK